MCDNMLKSADKKEAEVQKPKGVKLRYGAVATAVLATALSTPAIAQSSCTMKNVYASGDLSRVVDTGAAAIGVVCGPSEYIALISKPIPDSRGMINLDKSSQVSLQKSIDHYAESISIYRMGKKPQMLSNERKMAFFREDQDRSIMILGALYKNGYTTLPRLRH